MTKMASAAAPLPNPASGKTAFSAASARVQGAVERIDLASGIDGWAIDLEDPGRRLWIELLAGEQVIGRVLNEGLRADLPVTAGRALRIGFSFPFDAHDKLRELAESGADTEISFRIADTGLALALPAGAPRHVSEMLRYAVRPAEGLDMLAHLSTLRGRAMRLQPRPLRADGEHRQGFIEQVAIDESGLVWFCGWIKRAVTADMPVIVVDGQRMPGGLAMTMFPRDDLDGEACGVIGVIGSDWRPNPSSDLYLFLDDQQSYLQGVASLAVISKREFAETLAYRWPHCRTGHGTVLRHLLDHVESWAPTDGLAAAKVQARVEQLFLLPSFGCLVTGWTMSPIKTITGFSMKFGSSVLQCDPRSLSFRARPDLLSRAAGSDLLTERAGFVAVFRGRIASAEADDAILKALLDDGSSSNHPVEADAIRLLGHAASIDQLLHLYPTLAAEPFFPELATALCSAARAKAETPTIVEGCQAGHLMIFALSNERSDAFLQVSEIERQLAAAPIRHGIAFVAGRGSVRSDALALFRAFRAQSSNPCGLYLVDDPAAAFYALPEILTAAGAESFAYFGASLLSTEQGWAAAATDDGELALFGIADPSGLSQNETMTLEALRWNRAALVEWLATAPPYLHGPRSNASALIEGAAIATARGAWLLRSDSAHPLVRAMNAAVGG